MKKRRKIDPLIAKARLNRRKLSVVSLTQSDKDDHEYWARQTPQARLRALELMRRINYGDAATGRLQRLLEVVHADGTVEILMNSRLN